MKRRTRVRLLSYSGDWTTVTSTYMYSATLPSSQIGGRSSTIKCDSARRSEAMKHSSRCVYSATYGQRMNPTESGSDGA